MEAEGVAEDEALTTSLLDAASITVIVMVLLEREAKLDDTTEALEGAGVALEIKDIKDGETTTTAAEEEETAA